MKGVLKSGPVLASQLSNEWPNAATTRSPREGPAFAASAGRARMDEEDGTQSYVCLARGDSAPEDPATAALDPVAGGAALLARCFGADLAVDLGDRGWPEFRRIDCRNQRDSRLGRQPLSADSAKALKPCTLSVAQQSLDVLGRADGRGAEPSVDTPRQPGQHATEADFHQAGDAARHQVANAFPPANRPGDLLDQQPADFIRFNHLGGGDITHQRHAWSRDRYAAQDLGQFLGGGAINGE